MKTESENKTHDMHEKTVPAYDAAFAKKIVGTLDASLASIDDLSLLRLQKARCEALSYSSRVKRHWLSMSLAASIIMLIAVPVLWQDNSTITGDNADMDLIPQDIPLAAQEMDDMDMLVAMDDTDV